MDEKVRHTSGPLTVVTDKRGDPWLKDSEGYCVAGFEYSSHRKEETLANAERLRNCWNACEGIADPSSIQSVVQHGESLLAIVSRVYLEGNATEYELRQAAYRLQEAIKKAKGGAK